MRRTYAQWQKEATIPNGQLYSRPGQCPGYRVVRITGEGMTLVQFSLGRNEMSIFQNKNFCPCVALEPHGPTRG